MKKSFIYLFLFLIIKINVSFSKSVVLSGTLYDQSPARNPDFEALPGNSIPLDLRTGIVKSTLNSDKVPEYCCGDSPIPDKFGRTIIYNASTFHQWFVDVPGVNIPIAYNLVLQESFDGSGIYQYGSADFFPLDGIGFDDKTVYPDELSYNGRNFHFCLRLDTQFAYRPGDFFNFTGDDDVWVFFDNKLIIDLGGLHPILSKTVVLGEVLPDLIEGQIYDFDFFYCERHTANSDLFITTNVDFSCKSYDICGVCNGRNDTCCRLTGCSTDSLCLVANCMEDECVYLDKDCDDGDECTSNQCIEGIGCVNLPIRCDDNNDCTIDLCDSQTGCRHIEVADCIPCDTECVSDDPCVPLQCNQIAKGKCIPSPINCTLDNQCLESHCLDGQCIVKNICNNSIDSSSSSLSSLNSEDFPATLPPGPPTLHPTLSPTITLPPVPSGLLKHCLTCQDLGCPNNRCTYYQNQIYKNKDDCNEDNCCDWSPTCF